MDKKSKSMTERILENRRKLHDAKELDGLFENMEKDILAYNRYKVRLKPDDIQAFLYGLEKNYPDLNYELSDARHIIEHVKEKGIVNYTYCNSDKLGTVSMYINTRKSVYTTMYYYTTPESGYKPTDYEKISQGAKEDMCHPTSEMCHLCNTICIIVKPNKYLVNPK